MSPGLDSTRSPARTRPAMMSACARVRLSASPRSSIKTSTLFLAMDVSIHHGERRTQSFFTPSCLYDKPRYGEFTTKARAVACDCFVHKVTDVYRRLWPLVRTGKRTPVRTQGL